MSESDPHIAWRIAEKGGTCFLSFDGKQIPMSPIVRKDEGAIYFLSDAQSGQVRSIGADTTVQLTFSHHSANDYLFIEGAAQVSNDREKIRDVWSVFAKAFWDSPDDENIRLITVSPNRAEFWDGPNSMTAAVKMLFAAATGDRPDMGENRKTGM